MDLDSEDEDEELNVPVVKENGMYTLSIVYFCWWCVFLLVVFWVVWIMNAFTCLKAKLMGRNRKVKKRQFLEFFKKKGHSWFPTYYNFLVVL
jgi:hypothetical protein